MAGPPAGPGAGPDVGPALTKLEDETTPFGSFLGTYEKKNPIYTILEIKSRYWTRAPRPVKWGGAGFAATGQGRKRVRACPC